MVNSLKMAVEKVKELPEEQQEYAARVLEHIAESTNPYRVPHGHRQAILKGLKQVKGGKYATATAVKKALRGRWA